MRVVNLSFSVEANVNLVGCYIMRDYSVMFFAHNKLRWLLATNLSTNESGKLVILSGGKGKLGRLLHHERLFSYVLCPQQTEVASGHKSLY